MQWYQESIKLNPYPRGFHLITHEILRRTPDLKSIEKGMMNVFIQHTSASLTINENAAPEVREDFETVVNRLVPESSPDYLHVDEGPDDLPAHIKSSLMGCSLMIPIRQGKLALGTWQGIYLCEHRDAGGSRRLITTYYGD